MNEYCEYTDTRRREYVFASRVLDTVGNISGADALCTPAAPQAVLSQKPPRAVMQNAEGDARAAVLLDFGRELHGSLRLVCRSARSASRPAVWTQSPDGRVSGTRPQMRVRVSLGESVSEALAHLGERNATNDHAVRDGEYDIPSYSAITTPESAFRFAFVELLDDGSLEFDGICAVSVMRDLPLLGSFHSSSEKLDRIWEVAVRTVHLNMQEYLWDGAKRDRLVWVGDMHPEILTVLSAFGDTGLVKKNFELMASVTDGYMNGFPTYSMWWVLCLYEVYMYEGDPSLIRRYEGYLKRMLENFLSFPEAKGEKSAGGLFLDWPTFSDPEKTSAGVAGILRMAFVAGADLLCAIGEEELAARYREKAEEMLVSSPDPKGHKGATALLALADVKDAKAAAEEIAQGGAHGFSTFLGYYLLAALAKGGRMEDALSATEQYWGAMLDKGATSFWEDFDLTWAENSSTLDRMPENGERDIHGDFGAYCYRGLRHSLCHGWASGPCSFLTRHVLGVTTLTAGMRRVRIRPCLGSLTFAKGTVPTPHGVITVSHTRGEDGKIHTEYTAPSEVEVVLENQ